MATSIDQKNFVKTALRLPPELHAAAHEAAQNSGRSYNAELIDRLSSTFEQDTTIKLLRGNMVLLRALADFVVLRHNHPDVAAPMEEHIIKMANAIKTTADETELAKATREPLTDYMMSLVAAVNKVNELLGPGWAKKSSQNHRSATESSKEEAPAKDPTPPSTPTVRRLRLDMGKPKRT